jgi:hypothetical protein
MILGDKSLMDYNVAMPTRGILAGMGLVFVFLFVRRGFPGRFAGLISPGRVFLKIGCRTLILRLHVVHLTFGRILRILGISLFV